MTPIVIRSVAQRELFERIAAGVAHPSLSAEDARAALAAHGGFKPLPAGGLGGDYLLPSELRESDPQISVMAAWASVAAG